MNALRVPSVFALLAGASVIYAISVAAPAPNRSEASKRPSSTKAAAPPPALQRVTLCGSGLSWLGKTTIDMKHSRINYVGSRDEMREFGTYCAQVSAADIKGIRELIDAGSLRSFEPKLSWFKKEWTQREIMIDGSAYLVLTWSDKEVVLYMPPPPFVFEGLRESTRKKVYERVYDLRCRVERIENKYINDAWRTDSADEEAKHRQQLWNELREVGKRSLPQGRKGW